MSVNEEIFLKYIPSERKKIYEFYRLRFDKSGCPMKSTSGGLVFHPLIPAYLIVDFINIYEKSSKRECLNFCISIASSALSRFTSVKDYTAYFYEQEDNLSYMPSRYYSALTQAWYIKALTFLQEYSFPEKNICFKALITNIYNSLLVQIPDGGVLNVMRYGCTVEEYPHNPPLYTLNGWLTVLRILKDSLPRLNKIGINVTEFFEQNLNALANMLPLYDASTYLNSRYQLTGFSRVRLVFDRDTEVNIHDFSINIPGEGKFSGSTSDSCIKNRWQNYLERQQGRLTQFNVVLSLISYPSPNSFSCSLTVESDCEAKVYLADGDYHPEFSAMPTHRWRQIDSIKFLKGKNRCKFELPFNGKDLFAYPTNFKKCIDGVKYNVYHFVHVIALAELYSFMPRNVFKGYALKWLDYTREWVTLNSLSDENLSLLSYKYGNELYEKITRLVA